MVDLHRRQVGQAVVEVGLHQVEAVQVGLEVEVVLSLHSLHFLQ